MSNLLEDSNRSNTQAGFRPIRSVQLVHFSLLVRLCRLHKPKICPLITRSNNPKCWLSRCFPVPTATAPMCLQFNSQRSPLQPSVKKIYSKFNLNCDPFCRRLIGVWDGDGGKWYSHTVEMYFTLRWVHRTIQYIFLNETMIFFKKDLRAKSINSSGDSFIVIFKYTLVVAAIKCWLKFLQTAVCHKLWTYKQCVSYHLITWISFLKVEGMVELHMCSCVTAGWDCFNICKFETNNGYFQETTGRFPVRKTDIFDDK